MPKALRHVCCFPEAPGWLTAGVPGRKLEKTKSHDSSIPTSGFHAIEAPVFFVACANKPMVSTTELSQPQNWGWDLLRVF